MTTVYRENSNPSQGVFGLAVARIDFERMEFERIDFG